MPIRGKGTNTKRFRRENIAGSLNTSSFADFRKNNQVRDIGAIFEELRSEFANVYIPHNVVQEILKEAAEIGVDYAQREAPVADKTVNIYNTAKVTKKYRAPKGKGRVVKRIKPGRLADYIMVYKHGKFKKLHSAVFYGPKYPQVAYAHLPEFGSKYIKNLRPYMKPSFEKAVIPMVQLIKRRYRQELIKAVNEAKNNKQYLK